MKKTIAVLFSLLLAMMVFHVAIAAEANDETEPTPIDPIVGEETPVENEEPVLIEEEIEPIETEVEEEEETEPVVPGNETDPCEGIAGITPDHPGFWGLERSLERIQELLTFSEEGKINLGLKRARERHCEIIKMLEQKKFQPAEKAKVAYENQLKTVEKRINSFGNGDVEEDSEKLVALKAKIQAQVEAGEKIQAKVKSKMQEKLTEEQKTQLNEMVKNMDRAGFNVRQTVKDKQNKVEVKVKAKLEKSDEEIEKQPEKTTVSSEAKNTGSQIASQARGR